MIFGKYVNRFYFKYFLHFFIGVLFLILVDYVQLLVPQIIGDLSRANDNGTLTEMMINQGALNIFYVAIFMFTGRFIWRVSILSGAFNIASDLREDMFVKCEKLSQRFYQENKVGAMMSYFTNDLDTIQEAYGWGTVMLVDSIFLTILTFYKMLRINLSLSLICLIPLILLCIFAYFIDNKIEKIYNDRQKAFERMSDYVQELFTGLRVIKAFVNEIKEAIRFKKVNEETKNKDLALVKFSAFLDTGFSILIEGMTVVGLTYGAFLVYQGVYGDNNVNFTRADMIEFVGYFNTIIWPMIALGQIVALRSRAKTSLKRISNLLDEKIDVTDLPTSKKIDKLKGKITFKNFSYSYLNNDVYQLENINLEINVGENIGIVGKIGSGKTTLVSSLLRLDNFKKGTLFLDDNDIMDLKIKDVRNNISFVPQDNFLFSTSIEDNVAFSEDEIKKEKVIEACKFADVDNNIVDFIDGYKTLVGERGVTLSGGQKQRISIARAYLKDSPIMVLDDSVSAVDVKTEEKILSNIKEKRKGKTTILVSSRVSTVEHLDRIIVLNEGKVEAFDTHENLLKISPTYKRMVDLQKLEESLGEKNG